MADRMVIENDLKNILRCLLHISREGGYEFIADYRVGVVGLNRDGEILNLILAAVGGVRDSVRILDIRSSPSRAVEP